MFSKPIKLKTIESLKPKEYLEEMPPLVKKYLSLRKKKANGRYFKISIEHKSTPRSDAGIAYSNELVVTNSDMTKSYSTGMLQYRGAFNYEIDDKDLAIYEPAILKETATELTYGFRTGSGNIKVFRFQGKKPKLIAKFNISNFEKTQQRISLLEKMLDDVEAFKSYVEKGLENRWNITEKNSLDNGTVVIFLIDHADRDYDAISNLYQIYVWVKGKGFGISEIFQTGLKHPVCGKFYRYGIWCKSVLEKTQKDSLLVVVEVKNSRQEWSRNHQLNISW